MSEKFAHSFYLFNIFLIFWKLQLSGGYIIIIVRNCMLFSVARRLRSLPDSRQTTKEVTVVSTNFFSSLNGKFDLNSSMSSLYGDYNQIKSGAYGSLMKSYVKKVGNKSALKAYQETGSTTVGEDTSSATSAASTKKKASSKSNFLDSHLSSIKSSGSYTKSDLLQKIKDEEKAKASASETTAGTNLDTTI